MKLLPLLLLLSAALHAQLITEIQADPSPSRGLPEFEYIEIYNPLNFPLQLKGYQLRYAQSVATFPDFLLLPDSYAIVCRYNRAADFAVYGPVIPLPNFSLPNEGSSLLLISPEGKLLDEVHYQNTWFQGKEGYSLERLHLAYPCLQASNWAPSTAPSGGSPGKKNQESPPLSLPATILLETDWTDSTIVITFSQALSRTVLQEDVKLEGGEVLALHHPHPETLILQYKKGDGPTLTLHLRTLQDCLGRSITPQTLQYQHYPPPSLGEIYISEISYAGLHPDYIEIKTTVPVQLKGWTINRLRGTAVESILLSHLSPANFTVYTDDTTGLRAAFPHAKNLVQISPFLVLPQDSATLVLRSPLGQEYDRIHYYQGLHSPLLPSTDAVALERLQYSPTLWQSAPTASGHGSPGLENSLTRPGDIGFWVEPEIIDPLHESVLLRYNFPSNGLQANLLVLDRYGKIVKTFADSFSLGGRGEILWDGKGEDKEILKNGLYVFAAQVYGRELRKVFYTKIALFSP